jgi:hypothetical protein
MQMETRTRITLLFPPPCTLWQHYALNDVLDELTKLCGGITRSMPLSAFDAAKIFRGQWFDSVRGRVTDEEDAVVIFADAPFKMDNIALRTYLMELKIDCQCDFEQDIIWITIHHIDRIAAHDYVR